MKLLLSRTYSATSSCPGLTRESTRPRLRMDCGVKPRNDGLCKWQMVHKQFKDSDSFPVGHLFRKYRLRRRGEPVIMAAQEIGSGALSVSTRADRNYCLDRRETAAGC